jgi:hypothetical protein
LWPTQQAKVILKLEPEPHSSPAKTRRDQERSAKHKLDELIQRCYDARDEEKRQYADEAELILGREQKLVEDTAFHDEGIGPHPSPGETDVMIDSDLLDVQRGDVWRDKKIPGYRHPSSFRR